MDNVKGELIMFTGHVRKIQLMRRKAGQLTVAGLVIAGLLLTTCPDAQASIEYTYQYGTTGRVWQPTNFISGMKLSSSLSTISIKGPYVTGNGDQRFPVQLVFYDAWVERNNGYGWVQYGQTKSSWGQEGWSTSQYNIKFPDFTWDIYHPGKYTVKFRVRWFNEFSQLLGARTFQPNSAYDFIILGGSRYSGHPAYWLLP
ncbi:MAG: hypothetical protein M3430_20520 [Acidobacteriota bacterium]|nr:hypothetical protein [Acidobacteriota bacterium]